MDWEKMDVYAGGAAGFGRKGGGGENGTSLTWHDVFVWM